MKISSKGKYEVSGALLIKLFKAADNTTLKQIELCKIRLIKKFKRDTIDMDSQIFNEGERVYVFDFDCKQLNGTIHKNIDYPDVSEWFIKYDDGEEYAVIDINSVYKLKN